MCSPLYCNGPIAGLALLDFGFDFFLFAVFGPKAVNLADVASGGEGGEVVVLDIGQELAELVLGEKHFQLDGALVGVATNYLVEGAAAVQLVDDIAADAVVFLRNDTDAFAVVERGGEVVDHETVNPGADKTDDYHAEVVDEECGAADNGTGDGDRGADVEVEVLVDYLGEDVQSAGGGVDAEHKGLRSTQKQDEAAEVEPGIAHDGHRAGGDVLVRDVLPGEDGVPHIGKRTQNHSGVDRLGSELMPNQNPCQDKQDGVDGHNDDREADIDTSCHEDVVEYDGETGDGADNELAGHQKVVDGGGSDEHAEGHNDQFLPKFEGFEDTQGINNFIHFAVFYAIVRIELFNYRLQRYTFSYTLA